MLLFPESGPALGASHSAFVQPALLHDARQTLHLGAICPRRPQDAIVPAVTLPSKPPTPDNFGKETLVAVLQPAGAPATPPESPFSIAEAEPDERPAKRPCLRGPGGRLNNESDVEIDDVYYDHGDVFLARPHADDPSLPLSSVAATPESFISDDLNEAGRAEEDGPGYAFQVEDDDIHNVPAHSRHSLGTDGLETPETEVCFGMIGPLPIKLIHKSHDSQPASRNRIHVQDELYLGDDPEKIFLKLGPTLYGTIERRHGQILQVLSHFKDTQLQLRAIHDTKVKQKARAGGQRCGNFYAIVYGPFGISETIGDFLDDNDVFLQPPQGCSFNRRYRNPHALAGLDLNAPYTNDADLATQKAPLREWEGSSNYLDDVEFSEKLEEKNPTAIATQLLKHQRQGLYFMLQREKGWALTSDTDVWGLIHESGVPLYRNRISDEDQLDPPVDFRGGILADEMGLGKTLTVTALIASDRDVQPSRQQTSNAATSVAHTLIIVPPALLDTWEGELAKHCSKNTLCWARHHNTHKFTQDSQLEPYDIVLTTYETVRREWQARHTSSSSFLFRTRWHRLVLDEAHVIRNSLTKTAEAVCEIQAERRWAVTGTPIQNHVTDFVALLQFLRVAPYDRPAAFDDDIVQLWKVDEEEAIARLKRLITCIGLRRTSRNIDLPTRQNFDQGLYFSPQEKQLYESVNNLVNSDMLSSDLGAKNNALQGINTLRLICNFGTLTSLQSSKQSHSSSSQWGPQAAQDAFNALIATGTLRCLHCRNAIASSKETSLDMLDYNTTWEEQRQPEMTECHRVICGTCAPALRGGGLGISWCDHGQCVSHPVSTHEDVVDQARSVREPTSIHEMPTKIKALCHDLFVNQDSKAVVFSEWRRTLDLTARALQMYGIPFLRYDGSVTQRGRTLALERFSKEPEMKVILFTIRCGAVGLDLTAADRVYLMEPQWNPTIEDQAFARVHRMGQKRPVTAIRFIMSDSYEEKVVSKQGRKKDFADIALSPKKSPGGGAGGWDQWKDVIG